MGGDQLWKLMVLQWPLKIVGRARASSYKTTGRLKINFIRCNCTVKKFYFGWIVKNG